MHDSDKPRHRKQSYYNRLATAAIVFMLSVPSVAAATADHSQFESLQQPFTTGPEVTAACLDCHTEAATQIHETTHWTWEKTTEDGEKLGKNNILNNFCVAVTSNEPRCTSCHIGYGYKDNTFDFTNEEAVDCLVCHDTTGDYKKFPVDAGHPNYVEKEWPKGSGIIRPVADLSSIAQSVGEPNRENCGSCHFYGGGGDAVKHGDLDSSMTNPSFELDVHLSPDGQNFTCQTCHTSENHSIDGSRYEPTVSDSLGMDYPGHTDGGLATCESCHDAAPHSESMSTRLNKHSETIACQTCHIPEFARELPTKTWWDWSTAGQKNDAGKPFETKGDLGMNIYDSKKGDFVWEKNVVPDYAWFNGDIDYTVAGQTVAPNSQGIIELTTIGGSAADETAKIWPFKIMRGKQAWDPINKKVITPHLFGSDPDAYWKTWDWEKAFAAGQQAEGVEYSGTFEWINTIYHWPITHMVAPSEKALDCESCHSNNSRLAALTDFYLPARDNSRTIDYLGWALVILTLAGVLLHGLVRVVLKMRKIGE